MAAAPRGPDRNTLVNAAAIVLEPAMADFALVDFQMASPEPLL